jgi:hypothetical protein
MWKVLGYISTTYAKRYSHIRLNKNEIVNAMADVSSGNAPP